MNWHNLLLMAALTCAIGCSGKDNEPDGNQPDSTQTVTQDSTQTTRTVGADLSQWIVYRDNGAVYTDNGKKLTDIPAFFVQNGFNTARIRLFVNPNKNTEACQDLDYVIQTAEQCLHAGMQICLDFHYSDTWADPGKQYTPAAWASLDAAALATKVYEYTRETLLTLKSRNIVPAQIQIGNEITAGMLWESGRVDVWNGAADTPQQWGQFLAMLRNASKACREVCPEAKIIVHIDRGGDSETATRYYGRIASIDYDVIGLSYYPFWHGTFAQLEKTLDTLAKTYPGKEIMVVETAYPNHTWGNPTDAGTACSYPFDPNGQAAYLSQLVQTLKKHEKVTGVFYWYPEETLVAPFYGRIDLHRGLFSSETGEALPGISKLKDFLQE